MRYIPIDKLKDIMGKENFDNWLVKANNHLDKIRTLSKQERSAYFTKNNIWTELYKPLSEISCNKCWYSEAPENSGEWEVDHFRPKGESKNNDGSITLAEGYWWLAYYWRNYRLIGSLANKLRKDRFNTNDEVYGKGTFFPLDLDNGYIAVPDDFDCSCEIPYLLDPTNYEDVILISFDENGEVFPTYGEEDDEWRNERAKLSIKYYGLNHTPIIRGRKKVWDQCESIVNKGHEELKRTNTNPIYKHARKKIIGDCYSEIVNLAKSNAPYSMVVRSFVEEKARDPEFFWFKHVIKVFE